MLSVLDDYDDLIHFVRGLQDDAGDVPSARLIYSCGSKYDTDEVVRETRTAFLDTLLPQLEEALSVLLAWKASRALHNKVD